MSLEAHYDTGESSPIATTVGWNDFTRWVESLDVREYPELAHLADHGWEQDLGLLAGQLEDALDSDPPSIPSVRATAKGLSAFLRRRGKASAIVVSDGTGSNGIGT